MKQYYISFDTKDMPGRIKATRVGLATEVVRDMKAKMRVDLAADPHYADLERYVHANPSGAKSKALMARTAVKFTVVRGVMHTHEQVMSLLLQAQRAVDEGHRIEVVEA